MKTDRGDGLHTLLYLNVKFNTFDSYFVNQYLAYMNKAFAYSNFALDILCKKLIDNYSYNDLFSTGIKIRKDFDVSRVYL